MSLKIRKSPALTLVLVVTLHFSSPLGKVKWKRENKKRNNMGRKSSFSLHVCIDHFSTTKIKRNIIKGKVVKIHSFFQSLPKSRKAILMFG